MTIRDASHERGIAMHALATELYPLCRSITGNGLRATLDRLRREIPLSLREVPSGTQVLDWTIPDEWNIRDAWIADAKGSRVVDFAQSNLHVVNYSVPVRGRFPLAELRKHLFSLPDRPDWIPYRTTYYKREWGFCLSHRQLEKLLEPEYDVCIDSTIAPGSLTYGELLIVGDTPDEFLISAHACHPSLANDNLSGMVVAVELARELARRPRRRLSYRFIFAPGTIGAIAWLAANEANVNRIKHGLILTCVGDGGSFHYKRSRRGDAAIDQAVARVLEGRGAARALRDFSPYGYDERQYCSPGFDLPVGCFMRSEHGTFPEYHTSADNLSFITVEALGESYATLLTVIDVLESGAPASGSLTGIRNAHYETKRLGTPQITHNGAPASSPDRIFVNLHPKGEPQLGKYGFYEAVGSDPMPTLWVLNLSDGRHSLFDIAGRASLPFDMVAKAADVLVTLKLIREVSA